MSRHKRRSAAKRRVLWIAGALAFCSAALAFAYNPFQDLVSGQIVITKWSTPNITWELNPSTPDNNVTTSGGDTIQTAITNAFNSWMSTEFCSSTNSPCSANGVVLNDLNITFAGPSTLTSPSDTDCQNVVGFSDTKTGEFPTGTIAFTEVTVASGTPPFTVCGQTSSAPTAISDADLEFNPNISFSTTTPVGANDFDVQSVATHEIGHLLGLDHSGIGHTVMFPFGDTSAAGVQRTLSTDDLMGIAFLYPSGSFTASTGAISGTVTLSGTGAFAAHVVVIDTTTGDAVLDRLTNTDGTYTIAGVPPGSYNVLVLPLAPNDNAGLYSLSDYSGWSCGYGENSQPCCDPSTDTSCTGTLMNPTNYSGAFH